MRLMLWKSCFFFLFVSSLLLEVRGKKIESVSKEDTNNETKVAVKSDHKEAKDKTSTSSKVIHPLKADQMIVPKIISVNSSDLDVDNSKIADFDKSPDLFLSSNTVSMTTFDKADAASLKTEDFLTVFDSDGGSKNGTTKEKGEARGEENMEEFSGEEIDETKEEDNIKPICDSYEIRKTITGYAFSGKFPFYKLTPLASTKLTKIEKRRRLNELLKEYELPTLPDCVSPTTSMYSTPSIPKVQSISPTKPAEKEGAVPKMEKCNLVLMTTFDEADAASPETEDLFTFFNEVIFDNDDGSKNGTTKEKGEARGEENMEEFSGEEIDETKEEDNIKPICDSYEIRKTITGHACSGKIPSYKLTPLASTKLTKVEKRRRLNELLKEYKLPTLPDCVSPTTSMYSTPSIPKVQSISPTKPAEKEGAVPKMEECNLGGNASSRQEGMRLIKSLEKNGMLPKGTMHKIITGEISPSEARRMVMEVAVKSQKLPPHCLDEFADMYDSKVGEPKVDASRNSENINRLLAFIKRGYLPPDTLQKLASGEITEEWLRANLTGNRDFVLSQLPEFLRALIESGEMPPDIEAAILSGSHNKSEIAKMIIRDDDLIRAVLPQKLLDMLQDRPVPLELKLLIVSGKNESEIKQEVVTNDELLKQMMSPSMFFFYNLFKIPANRHINVALSIIIIVVLVFIMVSLGCTMTITKIVEHAKKPKGVIIALFAQFVIMPASAFALTQAFRLETFSAIAVLICGCCPGGNLSNMLAYALSGDMNLSILMTTCSSILGLGLMPLSIYLYSQLIIPLDSGSVVPFDKIIINISLTIIPVAIGIAIRRYRPQWVTFVMRLGGVVLVVCTLAVAILSGVLLGDAFFIYFPIPVLACCAILPMAGYTLGYLFALIARENPKCRRTICVETGCQNVQLCGTVLKLAFDPVVVGVLFLMPLVYMMFQVIEAFLIILAFRLYNRIRYGKQVIDEGSDEIKKKSDLESADDKKAIAKEEKDALLNGEEPEKPALIKETESRETESTKFNTDQDAEGKVAEKWPLDGEPAPAYTDSLKNGGTENL